MKNRFRNLLLTGQILLVFSVLLSCSNVFSDTAKSDILENGIVEQSTQNLVSSWADDNNDYLDLGSDRYFLNNIWGISEAKSGAWQACSIKSTGWRAAYEMWSSDGLNDSVLGYPSILNGWHWGSVNPSNGKNGFPVRIYENNEIKVSWSVAHSNQGTWEAYNTAYDIWIGGIDQKWPSKPDTEIMIWLNSKNAQPLGTKTGYSPWIWGAKWDLWSGTMNDGSNSWQVYSFVRQSNTWSVSNKNISSFIYYLWKTRNWLDGRKYIVGIEAGNEIFQGKGYFETRNYSLSIK